METLHETYLENIVSVGNATVNSVGQLPRGFITKIVVIQTAGTPGSFTVDIFNSKTPRDTIPPGTLPEEIYRVMPQLTGGSGKLLYFDSHGVPFCSMDTPSCMVFRITPTGGSGTKTFKIALGFRSLGG